MKSTDFRHESILCDQLRHSIICQTGFSTLNLGMQKSAAASNSKLYSKVLRYNVRLIKENLCSKVIILPICLKWNQTSTKMKSTNSHFPTQGVFLVKMKNAFVPVKRVHSVNTFMNFLVPSRSEQSEKASL